MGERCPINPFRGGPEMTKTSTRIPLVLATFLFFATFPDPALAWLCGPGQMDCGGCVDLQTDPNNCGACGHVCAAGDVCIAGTCTPKTVASSCLPTSSLSVLIQGSTVTTYVPLGSWGEPFTGIHVVTIEPAPASVGTVATA